MKTLVFDYLIKVSFKKDCLTVACMTGKHLLLFRCILKKNAVISVDGLVPAYYFAFIPTE